MNFASLLALFDKLPVLDPHPAGFLKGILRAVTLIALGFLIGGVEAVLPALQTILTQGGPIVTTIVISSVLGAVAGALKWLTTKRDSLAGGENLA